MTLLKHRDELDLPTWFGRRWLDWPEMWRDWAGEGMMRIEEFEEDGTLVVRAELPGIDPDRDVEITVTDHTVRLRAERKVEQETEDKEGYRSEFRYGTFERSLQLPAGASVDDVVASYRNGILEVRVPVDSAPTRERRIDIEHD